VIAGPANDMPPPLMSDLVRGNLPPKAIRAAFNSKYLNAICIIEEGYIRHENQRRPCLPKEACGLLSHSNPLIRQFAEEAVIDSGSILRLGQHGVSHTGRIKRAKSGRDNGACCLRPFYLILEITNFVR